MSSRSKYIRLLRAGLWNQSAGVQDTVYWKHVLALAANQSTTLLICHAALLNNGVHINTGVQDAMQKTLMRGANAHASANKVIAQVTTALNARGISSILLKGQGVASYYKVPELRQCGDIDLYVGPDNYEAACEVLAGITKTEGIPGEKHCEFEYGGGLVIELHKFTEILESKRMNRKYQAISEEGMSAEPVKLLLGGAEVLTPEDTFNAFYIFHHMWHHTIGMGIGLRQLCDWGMFLHTHVGKLDKARLKRWLEDMHLMDVWKVFGWAAVSLLRIPPDSIPFVSSRVRKRSHRLASYILDNGDNKEFKFHRSGSPFKKKLATVKFIFHKTGRLVKIFPMQSVAYFFKSLTGGVRKLASPGR